MKLSTAAAVLLASVSAVLAGPIYGDCSPNGPITVHADGTWWLGARCPWFNTIGSIGSGVSNVYLDLNACVGNNNGNLVRQNGGGMSGSCNDCVIENASAWLNCNCRRANQSWTRTRIDLNNFVYNSYQGYLYCVF